MRASSTMLETTPISSLNWHRRRRRLPNNGRHLLCVARNTSLYMDVTSALLGFPPAAPSSSAPLLCVLAGLLLIPPSTARSRDAGSDVGTTRQDAQNDDFFLSELGVRARLGDAFDSPGPRARTTPLYNLANATMAVVVGSRFSKGRNGEVRVLEAIRAFMDTTKAQLLQDSGLNVQYYSNARVRLEEDLTAVLTVADCEETWQLYDQVRKEVLFFAITEADCPRLPAATAITVPLSDSGGDLPQMVLDLKTTRTISWKHVTVLHDYSIGSELLDRVLRALSWESENNELDEGPSTNSRSGGGLSSGSTSLSVFQVAHDVTDWKRRQGIDQVLSSIPITKPESNFLIMVGYNLVGLIMDVAKSRGLVHPRAQWLYVISDADSYRDGISSFAPLLGEGENIAFASNVTHRQAECSGGLLCHCKEILYSFLAALNQSVRDESELAGQVSEEEWEAIRPTKEERMRHMLGHIDVMLRETGHCDNCTAWHLRAADTWGLWYLTSSNPKHASSNDARVSSRQDLNLSKDNSETLKESKPCAPSQCSDTSFHDYEAKQSRFWPERQPYRRKRTASADWQRNDEYEDEDDDEGDDEKRASASRQASASSHRKASQVVGRPPNIGRLISAGWWRPREGLTLEDKLFPHVSHGFRNRSLPFITVHNPPWQIISINETGHVVGYKGLIFEIINELAKNLNFTYSVTFPTDESFTNDSNYYYYKLENADDPTNTFSQNISWNKMIDTVRQRKMFLGAAGFTVTTERKRVINFTYPVSIQRYNFLVVRPRELSRALLFMSPFTSETWLCIAISVIAVGPILNYFHRASPFYEYYGIRTSGGLNSVTNCLWYTYGALLQQGGAYLPDADSGRLVVGTWWLVVLVLVTTYCGNLVAALTFPRMEKSIHTLEELLQSRDKGTTWGFLANSPLHDHLKSSTDPRLHTLLRGARIHQHQDQGLLDSVRSGTHIFIDWRINLIYLMKKDFLAKNRCDFSLEPADFLEEQVAMVMSQGSPYLGLINEEIRRMHQVGLIEKWLLDYLPQKDRCWMTSTVQEANNHSVNLEDMQGSFFVLFLGFLFSACLIITECLWKRHKVSREKHVIKPFIA